MNLCHQTVTQGLNLCCGTSTTDVSRTDRGPVSRTNRGIVSRTDYGTVCYEPTVALCHEPSKAEPRADRVIPGRVSPISGQRVIDRENKLILSDHTEIDSYESDVEKIK